MNAPDADNGRLGWLKRHVRSEEGERRYARELGMLAANAALHSALASAGLTQKELAERLGKSKGFISRALNGKGNLTVGTITDILWACQKEWRAIELRDLGVDDAASAAPWATANCAVAHGSLQAAHAALVEALAQSAHSDLSPTAHAVAGVAVAS
jgi:transcriptional regulator with XRE-family HTH domain